MRFLKTEMHGLIDYLLGILLAISPWLFGFTIGGPPMWVPVIVGAFIVVYSVFTRYEYSLFKMVSIPAHLTLDGLSGIFLIASPWLFNFANIIFLPHVIFGAIGLSLSFITQTEPVNRYEHGYDEKRQ